MQAVALVVSARKRGNGYDDSALQELFDPDLPNSPALWAVLKGNHPGKAVTDNAQNPSQCVLRTDAALTYFGYQTSQDFLNQAIAHFRKVGPVWLVWPHKTSLKPPEIRHAEIVKRLEFYEYDPRAYILDKLRGQLPHGHDIRTINAQLFKRCEWRAEMEFYCGGFSNFLTQGIGICMMQENEIIVEAYASSLGKTRAEIGAITRRAYRGRGYAPITCAYLIEACEQRGYQAYWSCDADHIASIRVAQKLGFRQERAYTIYEYKPLS
jgi:RimJ/RimL family protein N-acetyltransferase